MAVYPERRKNRLTGTWVAEVVHLGVRVRKRFPSKREAERWADITKVTGKAPEAPAAAEGPPTFKTVAGELKAAGGPEGIWARGRDASVIQRLDYVLTRPEIAALPVDKVSYGVVEKLVAHLKTLPGRDGDKMAPATINRYITAISAVLSYAERKEYRDGTPQLPWQKVPKKKKQTYTPEQAAATLAALRRRGKDVEAFLFEVLDRTGFRAGELLGLRASQVDDEFINLDDPERVKNGETRAVWIGSDMAGKLRELIKNKQMPNYWHLYKMVKRANKDAGHSIARPLHTVRRTVASRTVAAEQDLQVAQQLLGHRNIQTTIGYRDVSREELRERGKKLSQHAGQSPKMAGAEGEEAEENQGPVAQPDRAAVS